MAVSNPQLDDEHISPFIEDEGRNVGFVVDNLLCTGCATCDAVCAYDAITMAYRPGSGVYEPVINEQDCVLCGACVTICPGFRLDLDQWPTSSFPANRDPLIGPYQGIRRAYSSDDEIRNGGASGGVITEILRYLFRSDRIDGAIVTRMSPTRPLDAEAVIVESEPDLIATQKSKYCPHPHNSILKDIVRGRVKKRRLAFVGLPSHVHGLRNLQRFIPEVKERIPYVLSPFTAHVPSKQATNFLLSLNGVKEQDVESIDYRGQGIPGSMTIRCQGGAVISVPHRDWRYWGHAFNTFFYPPREWLYADKLSQWADWSVGDNWQRYGIDLVGASTVVSRTPESEAIISEMEAEGYLVTEPMSDVDLVHDQDLKNKLNIGVRLKVWKWLGGSVPEYRPVLPVSEGDLLRTFRFAWYVKLCMLPFPVWFLKTVIWLDYQVRKRLPARLSSANTVLRGGVHSLRLLFRALRLQGRRKSSNSSADQILIIGGYGWKDIGDESMPHAVLIKLKSRLPNTTRYVMASPDPTDTAARYGETAIEDLQELTRIGNSAMSTMRWSAIASVFMFGALVERWGWRLALWPQARRFLDELSGTRLLFNVGGGNLNSLTRGELYKKSVTYLAARLIGVPVVLSGQTIGPFSRRSDRLIARFALNQVNMITFRDKQESFDANRALGVYRPIQKDAADDAITLPAVSRERAMELLAEETSIDLNERHSDVLVLLNAKASLSVFKNAGKENDLKAETDTLLKLAERLLKLEGVVVVFMATDFTETVDDRVVHREIYRRLSDTGRAYLLEKEYTDRELKGLISLADAAFGMRYHFHVFAAAEGVPFLGFASGEYQMRKLRGLSRLLNEPRCYFDADITQAEFSNLWNAVQAVLSARKEISQQLRSSVPNLRQHSCIAIDEAVRVMANSH